MGTAVIRKERADISWFVGAAGVRGSCTGTLHGRAGNLLTPWELQVMALPRTKSIGTKVTDEEYARLEALAGDQMISV